MPTPREVCDVVIIGAGPAGTATASLLCRGGWRVVVLERTRFPRFVIGESLLPRCTELLEEVGLRAAVESQGYQEKHGALILRGEQECLIDFGRQFTPGAAYTWNVPRAHFDEVLAREVASRGVDLRFEHGVERVQVGPRPEVVARGPDGAEVLLSPRFVVDASGYGRVLPRLLGLERPSHLPRRKGIFTHLEGDLRPEGRAEGHIWVTLHESGAWSWIIPFSGGRSSVGIVAEPHLLSGSGDDLEQCLWRELRSHPRTRARLAAAQLVMPPRSIEGYSVGITRTHGEGFCLVGNATEFLDPVFSSGVCLALESAVLAARAVDRELRGEQVDWQESFASPLDHAVRTFGGFVEAWYDDVLPSIFFAPDPDPLLQSMVNSGLAGFVWDQTNPFVRGYGRKLRQIASLLAKREQTDAVSRKLGALLGGLSRA